MIETCFVPLSLSTRNEGVSRNRRGPMEEPKGQIPIGPFVFGQAVRSQDIEDRAFFGMHVSDNSLQAQTLRHSRRQQPGGALCRRPSR